MKIQFIVCGWWYDEWDGKKNQTEFIDALYELKEENDNLDVMWTCHKTPPKIITEKFDYKEYENIGLEWGAYDKVLNDMDLDDDTFLFFIQDDMVVHDWSFINVCIDHFNLNPTTKVIGNGWNYPWDINPLEEARLSYWLKNGYNWRDYAKEENKHLFEEPLQCWSMRGSFFASKMKYIREVGGFDYVNFPLIEMPDGSDSRDPNGNTSEYLNGYKFTKVFGQQGMKYLSDQYRFSKYMTECGAGQVRLKYEEPPFRQLPDACIIGERMK
jgi:hypothetical protein